jgi:catechol 2,3-dioxygenase-like lactoylglutathione lyase family enzyme
MMASAKKRTTPFRFEGVTPILRVADTAASIHYYVTALGFDLDWQDPRVGFASVSRGKCHLFLCRGDQGHPGSWIWVGVGDADALLQEYRSSGAKIRHLPTNYPWAYEMQMEDLDDVLRLGSEPKENEPTGEWLDMHGRRWPPPDGGSKPD